MVDKREMAERLADLDFNLDVAESCRTYILRLKHMVIAMDQYSNLSRLFIIEGVKARGLELLVVESFGLMLRKRRERILDCAERLGGKPLEQNPVSRDRAVRRILEEFDANA